MSCLFRALAAFVPHDDAYWIRQKICNFLILNHKIAFATAEEYVRWESNVDLLTYVSQMRQPHIWGGATEIKVFCELYQMTVMVRADHVKNSKPITFTPTSNKQKQTIVKLLWTGNHYEPDFL